MRSAILLAQLFHFHFVVPLSRKLYLHVLVELSVKCIIHIICFRVEEHQISYHNGIVVWALQSTSCFLLKCALTRVEENQESTIEGKILGGDGIG